MALLWQGCLRYATLLLAGLPFRVVGAGDWRWSGPAPRFLIVPPGGGEGLERRLREFVADGGRLVALGEGRPDARLVWARERPGPTFLQRHGALRRAVGRAGMGLFRAYFEHRAVRLLLDRTNATQRLLQGGAEYNPLFRLPPQDERVALLDALGGLPLPRVQAEQPVAIEWWRQGKTDQLHLVNYADAPQDVTVRLPWAVHAQALSPDTGSVRSFDGRSLEITLDVYTILLFQRSSCNETSATN